MDDPDKGDLYKENIHPDGSLEKLKLISVVKGGFHNNKIIGDTWYPT